MHKSLQNHLLIATPSLEGSYFSRSVAYIIEHTEEGAMGIVVNQLAGMTLEELMGMTETAGPVDHFHANNPVMMGGPVSRDRGFILHSTQIGWSSSMKLDSEIMITTSKDILDVIGNDQGPEDSIIALGYSGWSAGQLEKELEDNSWLTVEADKNILFKVPVENKWQAAIDKLGIDIWRLSPYAGHA
ncbi:YqgE/AlgH family protein [Paraneptunicella aestuarii]|uniref:YqgE/AlgH family protein n=1 Tax=Paraneptunicella aestuarii TaxID=2831148 RepID=UPI001E2EEDC6|nr:YqgE/AlgH family protein [Paraneptunicella aestuarii]UAA39792.1 YqgE/AlgH family protein [Paraneptunicella aestuarii]